MVLEAGCGLEKAGQHILSVRSTLVLMSGTEARGSGKALPDFGMSQMDLKSRHGPEGEPLLRSGGWSRRERLDPLWPIAGTRRLAPFSVGR